MIEVNQRRRSRLLERRSSRSGYDHRKRLERRKWLLAFSENLLDKTGTITLGNRQ
jgi:hypothetical protein